MAGLDLFGLTHQMLATSIRLRSMRHELLTANVANADTPGYRPRDMDFDKLLRALLSEQESGSGMDGTVFGAVRLKKIAQGEVRTDGNGVDIDQEMSRLIENSLQYEASLNLISRKLSALRYAIGEGRR